MTTMCSICGRNITKNETNEKFVVCKICNMFSAKEANFYKVKRSLKMEKQK